MNTALSLGRQIPDDIRVSLNKMINPKLHYRNGITPKLDRGIAEVGELTSMLALLFNPVNRTLTVNGKSTREEKWAVKVENPTVKVYLKEDSFGLKVVLKNLIDGFVEEAHLDNMDSLIPFMTPASRFYHCDFVVTYEDNTIEKTSAKMGEVDAFAIINANMTVGLAASDGTLLPDLVKQFKNDLGITVTNLDELIKNKEFLKARLNGWSYSTGVETDPAKTADSVSLVSFSGNKGFNCISFSLDDDASIEIFAKGLKRNRPSSSKSGKKFVNGIHFQSFTIRRVSKKLWLEVTNHFQTLELISIST